MTVWDALHSAINDEMFVDPDIFLMYEKTRQDIHDFKVLYLLGMYTHERVYAFDTTEEMFVEGFIGVPPPGNSRAVIQFTTFNFSMQVMADIIDIAVKYKNNMPDCQFKAPIVLRGPIGVAAGVGGQHSQCFAPWYGSVLGLKVLAPYSAEDSRGLLKAAIRDPGPVVFLENELLYCESFPISEAALSPDFCLPIGKAKIEREGEDVTITTFSRMVGYALKAAEILEKEGINAEVINLRTIQPLDTATINASVKKTNRLITVEEGFSQHGVGAEICASISEESFEYLAAPVERIGGAYVHKPYIANRERLPFPQVDDIVRAAKRACHRLVPIRAGLMDPATRVPDGVRRVLHVRGSS